MTILGKFLVMSIMVGIFALVWFSEQIQNAAKPVQEEWVRQERACDADKKCVERRAAAWWLLMMSAL